jgi:hypothetical protein
MLKPFAPVEAVAWSQKAFYSRLLASSLLVPVFEGILMRGYVFRMAYQWSVQRKQRKENALQHVLHNQNINNVEFGAWSIPAVLFSTIAFMVGHEVAQ